MLRKTVADCSATRGDPFTFCGLPPLTGKAMANEAIQGDEWGTYSALGRTTTPYHGIAYGARALRRRKPHNSLRSGKPPTRRRGTGDLASNDDEVCVMQSAEIVLDVY